MEADTYSTLSESSARDAGVTPTAIESGSAASSFSGAAPEDTGEAYPRRFANPALNSRVAAALPESNGPWEVQWQMPLDFPIRFVLVNDDRAVMLGRSQWQLVTLDGEPVHTEKLRHSELVLSSAHGQFYFQDRGGYLTAHRLSDGAFAFSMLVELGDQFRRPYIVRRDNRMILLGIERQIQPHALPPEEAHVEVVALGNPQRVNEEGLLASQTAVALRSQQSTRLLAALQGDTLTLATDNQVFRADLDLAIRTVLTDEFVPLSLSLDGEGRMYLVIRDDERYALWGVTPDGERFLDIELPAWAEEIQVPPIIGYGSLLYLVARDQVLAFQPNGKRAWQEQMGGFIGGAVVTPSGQLLVAAGPMVVALDEAGERELLLFADGETLATPPVLTQDGRLVVASTERLYCLQPWE